jgi:hypothetical protein
MDFRVTPLFDMDRYLKHHITDVYNAGLTWNTILRYSIEQNKVIRHVIIEYTTQTAAATFLQFDIMDAMSAYSKQLSSILLSTYYSSLPTVLTDIIVSYSQLFQSIRIEQLSELLWIRDDMPLNRKILSLEDKNDEMEELSVFSGDTEDSSH